MTDDAVNGEAGGPGAAARAAVQELADAGLLDWVIDRAGAGELALTGEGGFLPEMVKAGDGTGSAKRNRHRSASSL